jgi:hypothetical protein
MMVVHGLAAKAVGVAVTGVAGAAVYDGAKKLVRGRSVRQAAVMVTSWGLRGARAVEVAGEKVRLGAADIASEARAKIGEQTLPGAGAGGGHDHEH